MSWKMYLRIRLSVRHIDYVTFNAQNSIITYSDQIEYHRTAKSPYPYKYPAFQKRQVKVWALFLSLIVKTKIDVLRMGIGY